MPLTSRARSTPTSARRSAPFSTWSAYDHAYKIAWEAPRFWEKESNIYGGISYLQQTVELVWYPSARLFSNDGIIIGGITSVENGTPFPATFALPNMQAKLDALTPLHRAAASRARQRSCQADLCQVGADPVQPRLVDQ